MIAVKQGARGATARGGGELVYCEALAVEAADMTGAGDCFDAEFVFGYLRRWSLTDALKLACACGSLSTRRMGGTAGHLTLEEELGWQL